MAQRTVELQQLKGVGSILAQRLCDAGLDTFGKIVKGGEEGLRKIPGLNPRSISSILKQAEELAESAEGEHPKREEALTRRLAVVREKLDYVAQSVRLRYHDELAGKSGRKISADLLRIEDALVQLESTGKRRVQRVARALRKADKRATGIGNAGLKKIRKRLKKIRKNVTKAAG